MPFASFERAHARRALTVDVAEKKTRWLQHGLAALAVSVLGLAVAGSVALTGSAQQTTSPQPTVQTSIEPGVALPSAFDREQPTSRTAGRPALTSAQLGGVADQRAQALSQADQRRREAAQAEAFLVREAALAAQSKATRRAAAKLAKKAAAAPSDGSGGRAGGTATLPVARGYTIAARFGAVGSWSRYHTGFDFSAPVGTPINSPQRGVVTTAGSGPASGWAGTYVTVRHPDGNTTLYAHMSTVSVKVGQSVAAGQTVGAVGMTGRTFGAHVHFELYPAGVEPGDVYRAVDPAPWLRSLGLRI